VDGVDDLGVIDPVQIHACDPEVPPATSARTQRQLEASPAAALLGLSGPSECGHELVRLLVGGAVDLHRVRSTALLASARPTAMIGVFAGSSAGVLSL